MAANVVLCLSVNDQYQPALSIPIGNFQRFSTRPLAWLRYLGFTIYGHEGHISIAPGGQPVDYSEATIQHDRYYYVADDMRLLDPDLMDDRTSDRTSASTRRGHFRTNIIRRDGICVATGIMANNCETCHLIPHAKGDEYIRKLVNRMHGNLDPPVEGVDDIRNGILLYTGLHRLFGESAIAFLRTPNFAMGVGDVDLVIQPGFNHVGFDVHPSAAERRLTMQHFAELDYGAAMLAPHNSDARISADDGWPPPLFFDALYGSAALISWGVRAFKVIARQNARPIFYGRGGTRGRRGRGLRGNRGRGHGEGSERGGPSKLLDRAGRLTRRNEKKGEPSQVPDAFDMILGLWTMNAQKSQDQARKLKEDRTRDKVQTWLSSTSR